MVNENSLIPGLQLSHEILRLIAEIDELKGHWQALQTLSPVRLLPLSVTILKLLREHERLTIAELERLTEANRNTLKVRLRELVQAGQITKHGQV